MYVTLPNLLCFESVFTHLTWNCLVIHNWVEQKTETQNPSYSEFLAVFYSTRLDFNVFPISTTPQKFTNQNYFPFLFHEAIVKITFELYCSPDLTNYKTIHNEFWTFTNILTYSDGYGGRKQKSIKSQNL